MVQYLRVMCHISYPLTQPHSLIYPPSIALRMPGIAYFEGNQMHTIPIQVHHSGPSPILPIVY